MKHILPAPALLAICMAVMASCSKDTTTTPTPAGPQRWVKVYRDVVISDDSNAVEGQWFDSRNGQVYKMQGMADSLRRHVSVAFHVTQSGSYNFLTSPSSLENGLPIGKVTSLVASGNPYGLNYWSAAQKNSVGYRESNLASTVIDTLINKKSWDYFDAQYKASASGSSVDFTYEIGIHAGEVYLAQINNAVRMIISVNTASDNPATGFIKCDIVVEGRTDAPSSAADVMPSM